MCPHERFLYWRWETTLVRVCEDCHHPDILTSLDEWEMMRRNESQGFVDA